MKLRIDRETGEAHLVHREDRPNFPELRNVDMCRFESHELRCNAPAVWSDSPKGEARYCRYHSDYRHRGHGDEQRAYISSTYSWAFAERMILEDRVNSPSFMCYQHMRDNWKAWKRQPGESQAEFVARHKALQEGMRGLKGVPK